MSEEEDYTFGLTRKEIDTFIQQGPCMPIIISPSQMLIDTLMQQGRPIPPSIGGTALVDIGVSVSVIDLAVIEQLQLNPIGIVTLETAGGSFERNTYNVRFTFAGHVNVANISTTVVGVNLSRCSVNSIIGQDLLAHARASELVITKLEEYNELHATLNVKQKDEYFDEINKALEIIKNQTRQKSWPEKIKDKIFDNLLSYVILLLIGYLVAILSL